MCCLGFQAVVSKCLLGRCGVKGKHIALVYGCSFEKRYTLYPIAGVNEMIRIIPCPDL